MVRMATEANAPADPSTSSNNAEEIVLYVYDLDRVVTEKELKELFDHMGDVESVIICADRVTQESFEYGYVKYTNPEDAAKAMEVLNFSFLNGKQISISYSNREGSMSGISCFGTLFFKNLDKGFNKKEVKDIFSAYGNVVSCAVEPDSTGTLTSRGYVQFDSEKDARTATEELHGAGFNGLKLYVGPLCSKQEKELNPHEYIHGNLKFTNVYVGSLSDWITERDLILTFREFGSINYVEVARYDGVSMCYGFVNFDNWEDAAMSTKLLHRRKIHGERWRVRIADRQYEEGYFISGPKAMTRLCVHQMDHTIEDDDELEELFSRFGTITSCKIIRDYQGRSQGYGFVEFSTADEAIEAVSLMNNESIRCSIGEGRINRNRRLQSQGSTMHQTTRAPPPMVTTSMPPSSSTPAGVGHQNFYEPVSPIARSPMPVYHAVQQQAVPGVRPSSGPLRRTLYTHPMTQWAPYTPPSYGAPAGVGRQNFYVPVSPVQFPPMPVPQPVPAVWASGTMYPRPPGLYARPPMFPRGPQLQQFPPVYPRQRPAPWMDQQNLGDHL